MNVSVIISVYSVERLNDVKELLVSLHMQSLPPHEIFLVFDPDETLIETYRESVGTEAVFLTSPSFGLSAARNCGVEHASGDIVVFIDDDAIADVTWLENLMANYTEADVLAVGGNIIPEWGGSRPAWFPEELNWIVGCIYKGHPEKKTAVRNLIGCNMSFRRDIFTSVGGFASTLGRKGMQLAAAEETEFCMRLIDKNPRGKIIYDPTSIVYHKVSGNRKTLRYVLKRAYNEGLYKAKLSKMYREQERQTPLSTESAYLTSLPFVLFGRLRKVILLQDPAASTAQAFVLTAAVVMAMFGFIFS